MNDSQPITQRAESQSESDSKPPDPAQPLCKDRCNRRSRHVTVQMCRYWAFPLSTNKVFLDTFINPGIPSIPTSTKKDHFSHEKWVPSCANSEYSCRLQRLSQPRFHRYAGPQISRWVANPNQAKERRFVVGNDALWHWRQLVAEPGSER